MRGFLPWVVLLGTAGLLGCPTGSALDDEDAGVSADDAGRPVRHDAGKPSSSSGVADAGTSEDAGERPGRDAGALNSSSSSGTGSSSSSSSSGGCIPDSLEPNNGAAAATAVAGGSYPATACGQDPDFFKVDLAATQMVTATVRVSDTGAALLVTIQDGEGAVLATGTPAGGGRQAQVSAPRAGTYFLVVQGAQESGSVTYTLDVVVGPPPVTGCTDDALEPNDSLDSAQPVGEGTLGGKICPGDPDHFRVSVNAGDTVTATLNYASAQGALELALVAPEGQPLASSASGTGQERVSATVTSSGPHVLRVSGGATVENTYQLSLVVTPAPAQCRDDGYEQNDTAATASAVAGGGLDAVACPGDDDFYALQANAGDTVDLALALEGDGLTLEVRGPNGTVLLAAGAGGTQTRQVVAADSGKQVVRVTSSSSASPTDAVAYHLDLAVTPGASCTDDAYEDNDTTATARALAPGSFAGVLCRGDDDFYKVTLGAGDVLSAALTFSSTQNLDLYLLGPDGTVVTSSAGTTSSENVQATATLAGDHVLRVVGVNESQGDYNLQLQVTPATPTCHDDAYEDNDGVAAARSVPAGHLDAQVCRGDDDYFGVALNAGDTLVVTVQFSMSVAGDLDLILMHPDGRALDESSTGTGTESVTAAADAAGTYVVRVFGRNGAENAYGMDVSITPAPATCTDDTFEQNDSRATATLLGPGNFAGIICPADPDYFQVSLNAGDTLKVDLAFTSSAGDLDLKLLDGDGLTVASSVGTEDTESITYQPTAAGAYTVWVYGFQNAGNAYTMNLRVDPLVTACTDDAQEENDVATAARAINPGSTSGLRVCGADEDWFSVSVVTGDTVQVALTTATAGQNLDLQLLTASGTVLATSATASGNETATAAITASGTLLVRVWGGAGTDADYALDVRVTAAPPTCVDDTREPNDSQAAAVLLAAGSYTGLQICASDDDYYNVDVPAGGSLRAVASFTHSNGDLDLSLLNAAGSVLTSSVTTANTETVTYTATSASRLTLRVYGFRGAENSYALAVEVTGGTACTDDSYEDNDSLSAARAIAPGTLQGMLCTGDPDFYKLDLVSGDTVTADLLFTHANGDLDVRLRNPGGSVVATSAGVVDNEHLTHVATATGSYTVEVYTYGTKSNGYSLRTAVTAPSSCTDDSQEPNDTAATARSVPATGTSLKVCPANEDWFSIPLKGGETLSAAIAFTHSAGDLDLRLLDSDKSSVLASSLGTSDREQVSYQTPLSKTVYLRITGVSNASNTYTLTWSTTLPALSCPADDALEQNDNRETATLLSAGVLKVGQVCANDEDWFAIALAKGDALTLDMTPNNGSGDIDLSLHSPAGTQISDSINVGSTPEHLTYTATVPGVYFAKVYGYQGAQNRYALYAQVARAAGACQEDDREPNDTPAEAVDNDRAHLQVRTDTVAAQSCANDDDLYDVYLFSNEDLTVDLKYDQARGDLDVFIFMDDGTQVDQAEGVTGTEHLRYSPAVAGYYWVLVAGYAGDSGPYTLMSNVTLR